MGEKTKVFKKGLSQTLFQESSRKTSSSWNMTIMKYDYIQITFKNIMPFYFWKHLNCCVFQRGVSTAVFKKKVKAKFCQFYTKLNIKVLVFRSVRNLENITKQFWGAEEKLKMTTLSKYSIMFLKAVGFLNVFFYLLQ